jgi:hypothetical protein
MSTLRPCYTSRAIIVSHNHKEQIVTVRYLCAALAAVTLAAVVAACGTLQEAAQGGQAVATQAAELRGTAQALAPTLQAAAPTLQALAPTLQAQAGDLSQTAQALAPTLQAAAPTLQAILPTFDALVPTLQASGLQQTAEALATELPVLTGPVRATAEAFATQRVGEPPADVPIAPRSTPIYTSNTRLVYTTELAPAAVRELYEVDMPAQGWVAVPGAAQQGDATQLQFEKPGRRARVTIAPAPGGAAVEVSIDSVE